MDLVLSRKYLLCVCVYIKRITRCLLQGYTRGNIFLDFDWHRNCIFSSFSGLGLTQYGLRAAELHNIIYHRYVLLTNRYCIWIYLCKVCLRIRICTKYPNHLHLWKFGLHHGVVLQHRNWVALGGCETR